MCIKGTGHTHTTQTLNINPLICICIELLILFSEKLDKKKLYELKQGGLAFGKWLQSCFQPVNYCNKASVHLYKIQHNIKSEVTVQWCSSYHVANFSA